MELSCEVLGETQEVVKEAARPEEGQYIVESEKEPLPTTFPCLFCNHEKSVSVKMDKKAGTGELSCKVCGQSFQTGINYLSAAVDIYSDWIDACDTVAKEAAEADRPPAPSSYASLATGAGGRRNSDMDIDRHLVDVVDDDDDAVYGDA